MLLVRNWKGQNTGGALAVIKGLVGQVEGLMGKFSTTLYGKKCPATWYISVVTCGQSA